MEQLQMPQSDYVGSESTIGYFTDATSLYFKALLCNLLFLNHLEYKNYKESSFNYEKILELSNSKIPGLLIQKNIAYNYLVQGKFEVSKKNWELSDLFIIIFNIKLLFYGFP